MGIFARFVLGAIGLLVILGSGYQMKTLTPWVAALAILSSLIELVIGSTMVLIATLGRLPW